MHSSAVSLLVLLCILACSYSIILVDSRQRAKLSVYKANEDPICCMPKVHTVNATLEKTFFDKAKNSYVRQKVVERHLPNLLNGKYRLDLDVFINEELISSTSTIGFVSLPSLASTTEYAITNNNDGTSTCTCKVLQGPGSAWMRSCVAADKKLVGKVSLGLDSVSASVYRSTVDGPSSSFVETQTVQPIGGLPSDPECVIVSWDIDSTAFAQGINGRTIAGSNSTRIVAFNFKRYSEDADYAIPSFCPSKCQ